MRRPAAAGVPREAGGATLRARVVTGVLGAPVMLAALWGGGAFWLGLVAVVGLLGVPEVAHLYGRERWKAPPDVLALAVLLPIAFAYHAGGKLAWPGGPLVAALALPVVYALLRELFRAEPRLLTAAAVASVTVLYWGGLLAHLVLLRALPLGLAYGLVLVAGTWGADIAAYAVGRRWGRRPLAPRLSPGKTVEGTAAGQGVGFAAAAATGWLLGLGTTGSLIAGAAVVVSAALGDLVESGLKREAGVKDSGALLPGHGGVLDRFDSLLIAGTLLYYVALAQQGLL
ncbi:phosphatidate cytidylyltransferase [Limnochorda pilosa]|uniref:Phosphatidate cytidylyltransferase n=1 Tax=Limnochorda pilosa TaxID=1555112 RepID=A0A0K2SK86_LIMPI|nr:phosphatidate cytidylyltransferase [Limnochorda pilosa]BAS27528.1 phosphatidate cytidylyltransferase [Limnochorda pilosa]